jgi:DNA-binding MarR family transcriptional regulator/N-acetylglutamate synthase-like GNAT family acetyltransferase
VRAETHRTIEGRVEAIRRFNRFYTQKIGVVHQEYLASSFSLGQVRILYELAHRPGAIASDLSSELRLDPGYLSRTLQDFEGRGFLRRKTSSTDRRQSLLLLTKRGREAFARLDARARDGIQKMLVSVPESDQSRLLSAMGTIEKLLANREATEGAYLLRTHQPGDMGWIIHRHGVLYAQEYGWDEHFEALVAKIAAEFIQNFDPRRERCWIAEKDGEIVGCVFLVKADENVAKLRLLLVEPSARGSGIGGRLVDECVRFARRGGYRKIMLWTQSMLFSARRIYERAGFQLVLQEPHHSFGHDLIAETWELGLR